MENGTRLTQFIEEVRIRYVQTSSHLEQIYAKLRQLVSSGVTSAEETLGQVLDLLAGKEKDAEKYVKTKKIDLEQTYDEKRAEASASVQKSKASASASKAKAEL